MLLDFRRQKLREDVRHDLPVLRLRFRAPERANGSVDSDVELLRRGIDHRRTHVHLFGMRSGVEKNRSEIFESLSNAGFERTALNRCSTKMRSTLSSTTLCRKPNEYNCSTPNSA